MEEEEGDNRVEVCATSWSTSSSLWARVRVGSSLSSDLHVISKPVSSVEILGAREYGFRVEV
jgi:hypothetical protein